MRACYLAKSLTFSLVLLLGATMSCVTPESDDSDPALAAPKGSIIHIWTRGRGQYENHAVIEKLGEKAYDPAKNKARRAAIYDLQYGRKVQVAGAWLNDIISEYKPTLDSDMIILHFSNQLAIPVPLVDDGENSISKQVFLAFHIKDEDGKWSSDFPDIERINDQNIVVRRIRFTVNKIVVSSPEHPFTESIRASRARKFSPWRYANDLVGIEFVDQAAWERQFEVGNGRVAAGQDVFLQRCQYCHGVRSIGSPRGWDFDGPIKAHVKRDAESLFYHVKFPKAFAAEYGTSMPTQPTFTENEANDLWLWMRTISRRKSMHPYLPPAAR